jgi:hypothetical protein
MNLAPFSAYALSGSDRERKTRGNQRYYACQDDVFALHGGNAAGTLAKDTLVTLSDQIITRHSDHRQFTEVTLTTATKNTAGEELAAGMKVWTVSDQGFLKTSGPSVSAPSWWAKSAPVYHIPSGKVVPCTSRTDWRYYLSAEDVLQRNAAGKLSAGFPLTYEPENIAQQLIRQEHTFSLVTLGRDTGKLKKGDRVWVVSDGDSLIPATPASDVAPVYGEVVVPATPVAIRAGDSIGHLGFYQLPEENGKLSRYQVHIECLSMDDMEKYITNPGHAGERDPAFVKYPAGATLFIKNSLGQMVGTTRKSLAQGVATRAAVPVENVDGQPAYYQIHKEYGWLAAEDVQLMSQYALADRGFVVLDKAPASFDLINGTQQPDNIVKSVLEQLYQAAQAETRTAYVLNQYNYQSLLQQIDSNRDGYYSTEEYLQAIQSVSYRDRLFRIIAKHPSEWYYGKNDPLWKTYLDTLTTDAPLWKTYLETFIDKMGWMKKVAGMGPAPWHLHPVVFMDAFKLNARRTIPRPKNVQDFLDMAASPAEITASKWGVPASVLLAQSALESGWGKHVKNNAYFGIKGKSPSGDSVSFNTTEVINGKVIHIKDTFRAYADYAESADDYGRFLSENKRYKSAFSYSDKPNSFINAIAKAGYATDPNYAPKLIHLMECYDLYEFDK